MSCRNCQKKKKRTKTQRQHLIESQKKTLLPQEWVKNTADFSSEPMQATFIIKLSTNKIQENFLNVKGIFRKAIATSYLIVR